MYEVEITSEGVRHLNRLPAKIRDAALATIFGPIANGPIANNPHRPGHALVGELEGLRSARRGDYRIVYEVLEDEAVVLVHRIQHRRHAYRRR